MASSEKREETATSSAPAKALVTDGGFAGQALRMKTGATTGAKVEVAAGDFSTNRKPSGFFGTHGGDVLTEFVAGPLAREADPAWVKSQMAHAQALAKEGAFVGLGVDVNTLGESLHDMFGGKPPQLRKLKVENPAVTMEQRKLGDTKAGLAYSDIFAAADKNLAKGGVLEWGLTGPLHGEFQSKNMGPVFKQAAAAGFELVETRTKTAKSHTFSQEASGMRDRHLSQYVFARSSEAGGVREYTASRIAAKGGDGRHVDYGGKTRTLV
jgi:hypothetical protein